MTATDKYMSNPLDDGEMPTKVYAYVNVGSVNVSATDRNGRTVYLSRYGNDIELMMGNESFILTVREFARLMSTATKSGSRVVKL